jgi:type I restriction enzyme S subunit
MEPPSLPSQRRIADFLDRETDRIDALIDKKRRLIDLLEEKRAATRDALISGIDSTSAQLGRFVVSLSQGHSTQAGARPRDEGEWGILKLSAVRRGEYRPEENKALPADAEVEPSLVPQPDDLLITRSNTPALVGDVCAVTSEYARVLLPDLIYRIRLDSRVLPQFAAIVILGSKVRFHLASTARGSSGSMVKLRGEDLRAITIPVPRLDQQGHVIRELEQQTGQLRRVTDLLTTQLTLLAEYREALITAAVTGGIDVDTFDNNRHMEEATA